MPTTWKTIPKKLLKFPGVRLVKASDNSKKPNCKTRFDEYDWELITLDKDFDESLFRKLIFKENLHSKSLVNITGTKTCNVIEYNKWKLYNNLDRNVRLTAGNLEDGIKRFAVVFYYTGTIIEDRFLFCSDVFRTEYVFFGNNKIGYFSKEDGVSEGPLIRQIKIQLLKEYS